MLEYPDEVAERNLTTIKVVGMEVASADPAVQTTPR
jgi:hypothetical protein